MLQYQITDTILETFLYRYKNYNNFGIIEKINYVLPFSWNHIYFLANVSHLMWNIIVPKMYIIMLKILKVSMLKQSVIIFDGPCCDIGQTCIGKRCQDDIFPRIELNPSFVLSSDNTNCKNDIQ